ncbi:Lrp/AsnC family transcriptional regulator [Palaeococcus pacificus]|nr:Lrp/AsnC family transcriptional regulator [Palaeococcus pacificus]
MEVSNNNSINYEELDFLVEILTKYPKESLKKISELEGIEYYKLKRIYDKYYGPDKYVQVSTIYNIAKIGLKSFVAFISVPRDELRSKALEILKNPFCNYLNASFGFKLGIAAYYHIPVDQVKYIDELLSKYSDDYEYYEVRGYPKRPRQFGKWNLSYDYAILMDILKEDARTSISKISQTLGKTRPTVKYMIERLESLEIILNYIAVYDDYAYNRAFVGIAEDLDESIIQEWIKRYDFHIGAIVPKGYLIEMYFTSKEDIGLKILEMSKYVNKFSVEYLDILRDINRWGKFSERVRRDGKGYRSILDF